MIYEKKAIADREFRNVSPLRPLPPNYHIALVGLFNYNLAPGRDNSNYSELEVFPRCPTPLPAIWFVRYFTFNEFPYCSNTLNT